MRPLLFFMLLSTSLLAQEFDGFALYNDGNTSFLINRDGEIAHQWNCATRGNYSMFLKEDGNLVRGAINNGNIINGAAVGGLVQELSPEAEVIWEFTYSNDEVVAHHDICEMPDGGVLLTAWEIVPLNELLSLGYTGTNPLRYGTHFIEVQQEGRGGKIVWEWHIKDHFIQDVDSTLSNFGDVAANPQLMDINVGVPGNGSTGDWFHVNGVNHSKEFDQIVFSSRYLSEIFIIDHSTTVEEAAGHTGGNAGKGGDILWRWGNPDNYKTEGNSNISAAVHDAQFVPNDGRDFADHILIFNNSGLSGSTQIDLIELFRDGYNFEKEEGQPFAPELASKTHLAISMASGQSATHLLPNGNLYVNLSRRFQYEVDKDDNVIWEYPDASTKGFRYTCDHPGIKALIDQGYLDANDCALSNVDDQLLAQFKISPNPTNDILKLELGEDLKIEDLKLFSLDQRTNTTLNLKGDTIDVSQFDAGIYFLRVALSTGDILTKQVVII